MNCPACSHQNLSDFPFCEQCLALLPVRSGIGPRGAFELDDDVTSEGPTGPRWPPFPWNPRDLANPLIGRDRAVRELMAGFEEVVSTWRARIHLLVSESGMGKSRVATAFVEAARQRGDHMAVMYQHVQGKAKPPIEVNPGIPPGLSEIVAKAMTVDKARRFQTMDELRSALERYL